MCHTVVKAETHGKALRVANQTGWWRGRRGGRMTDLCGQHQPGSGKKWRQR